MFINGIKELLEHDVLYGYSHKMLDWVEVDRIETIRPINFCNRFTILGWDKLNQKVYFQVTPDILALLTKKFELIRNCPISPLLPITKPYRLKKKPVSKYNILFKIKQFSKYKGERSQYLEDIFILRDYKINNQSIIEEVHDQSQVFLDEDNVYKTQNQKFINELFLKIEREYKISFSKEEKNNINTINDLIEKTKELYESNSDEPIIYYKQKI